MLLTSAVVFLISISIYSVILKFVRKLETDDCKCSINWKREYIKYFSSFSLFTLSLFLLNIFLKIKISVPSLLVTIFFVALRIATIVNVYALFTYAQDLVNKKCKCSEGWERNIIYYFSMILASLYVIGLIGSILISIDIYNIKRLNKK